jgi:hypothetical protein
MSSALEKPRLTHLKHCQQYLRSSLIIGSTLKIAILLPCAFHVIYLEANLTLVHDIIEVLTVPVDQFLPLHASGGGRQ